VIARDHVEASIGSKTLVLKRRFVVTLGSGMTSVDRIVK
jgi:hypothetical protein